MEDQKGLKGTVAVQIPEGDYLPLYTAIVAEDGVVEDAAAKKITEFKKMYTVFLATVTVYWIFFLIQGNFSEVLKGWLVFCFAELVYEWTLLWVEGSENAVTSSEIRTYCKGFFLSQMIGIIYYVVQNELVLVKVNM